MRARYNGVEQGGSVTPDAVWDALGDALDADPTRATDLAAALVSAPVASTTQTGGSAGWTIANGTGSAAATGSAYTLSFTTGTASSVAPAADNPRALYSLASIFTPLLGRWRVTARVASAPDDANYRLSLAVGKTDLSAGVACVIGRSGSSATVELGVSAPSYSSAVAAGGSIPVDGTGWVRLTFAGGRVSLEYGTGTTTAQPSAWTLHGATVATVAWESVILYLTRWGGSNDLGGAFDDVKIEAFA